ncbi:cytochrome P450 [Dentipellis sp. KUC8613]|nr:cytochrome P450 [Dentipellis sp. KUC8613]
MVSVSPKTLITAGLCPVAGASVYLLYRLLKMCLRGYRSPLRFLPGPPYRGWLQGSFDLNPEVDGFQQMDDWVDHYGRSYHARSLFGSRILFTTDVKALHYILTNPTKYCKHESLRFLLGADAGDGAQHRQQNPAFGPAQVRELTSTMVQKAVELRDYWREQIAAKGEDELETDVLSDLDKTTLDIIGMGGFGYSFDALHSTKDHPNELKEALKTIFSMESESFLLFLQFIAPVLRIIPTAAQKRRAKAMRVVQRIGSELVAERKAAVLATAEKKLDAAAPLVGKKDIVGRDLLSLLIKANMASDLPESARMVDGDVLAQIPTFLMAGHETTSAGTAWALYALACNLDVQAKLRAELLEQSTDTPTMDELNALPYLDAVVREVLRMYPPAPATSRVASEDDVIPLEIPFVDSSGVTRHEIRINKDDTVLTPIRRLNKAKEIWGADAHEFKPERWTDVPEGARTIPSVFSNLLTFYAGPHACIGYRFALVEMKVLLYTLIRAFDFRLAGPPEDIIPKTYIVMKPSLASDRKRGECLPMIVRPVLIQAD